MDFTKGYDHIPQHPGLINSPPPPTSPLAYNEEHIIFLLTRIWEMHIALAHVPASHVVFPAGTPGCRDFLDDDEHVARLGLTPRVVSLMRRLPYHCRPNDETHFTFEGRWINFEGEAAVRLSRDPHFMGTDEDRGEWGQGYLQKQDLGLVSSVYGCGGWSWVLDTEANTIRAFYFVDAGNINSFQHKYQDYVAEKPEDDAHYRNWPPFHAPSFLMDQIQKLWTLEHVPEPFCGGPEVAMAIPEVLSECPNITYYRKRLLEDYGWPAAFEVDAWGRDVEEVWAIGRKIYDEFRLVHPFPELSVPEEPPRSLCRIL